MKAQFISEQYIKENTPINDNVDMKLLKTAIREAQDFHILESIGSNMYDDLSTKVIAGTLNADEKSFINDHLRPALMYWVMVEGIPLLLFKLTNKTVGTSDSDNTKPVEFLDMKFMVNNYKNKAEVATERMVRHIKAYPANFPLFFQSGDSLDGINPKSENYTTSWNFPE